MSYQSTLEVLKENLTQKKKVVFRASVYDSNNPIGYKFSAFYFSNIS